MNPKWVTFKRFYDVFFFISLYFAGLNVFPTRLSIEFWLAMIRSNSSENSLKTVLNFSTPLDDISQEILTATDFEIQEIKMTLMKI